MDRIKTTRDKLLEGTGSWILRDETFTEWLNEDKSRILWLNGYPGKGKTMLAISLIEELSSRIQLEGSATSSSVLAYFFCDNKDGRRNDAVSLPRGLICQVLCQRPGLFQPLRNEYKKQKDQLFSSPNALYALWRIIRDVLNHVTTQTAYFVIDALDECDPDSLSTFLKLLSPYVKGMTHGSPGRSFCRIKWLLTSRTERAISQHLTDSLSISLGKKLNASQKCCESLY
jgi:hypothetical protein